MSVNEVLIIDDNEIEIFVSRELLMRTGMANSIVSFLNASDGLHFLQGRYDKGEDPPALLLLDIHMPELTGFDFLDRFKAQFPESFQQKMQIFIISSTADTNDLLRAKSNPLVWGTLEKPLDTATLARMRNS